MQEFMYYGDHSGVEVAMYDYGLDHPDSFKDADPTSEIFGYFVPLTARGDF